MPEKILTYFHDRCCSKCGQDNLHNRFIRKGEVLDIAILHDAFSVKATQDVIRRHCSNCGYSWNELPFT